MLTKKKRLSNKSSWGGLLGLFQDVIEGVLFMSPLWCLGYQALDLTMEPIAGPIPKLAKCVFFICNLKTIFNNNMIHNNIV